MAISDIGVGEGLLVILGAGASHDSIPASPQETITNPDTPPLTMDLAAPTMQGNNLALRFERAQPLLDELRRRLLSVRSNDSQRAEAATLTLEGVVGEYLERRTFDPNVPSHVAAFRFYIRDLIYLSAEAVLAARGGLTNYTGLVTRCFQWAAMRRTHVCFVSFNYDHLLETACHRHFSFPPDDLDRYIADRTVSILKPHGSVLWAWPHPMMRGDMTFGTVGEAVNASIRAGEPPAGSSRDPIPSTRPLDGLDISGDGLRPVLPALALPIANKAALVWPEAHDRFFREQIPNGTFGRVLTVGWRAAEDHFTPLLTRLVCRDAKLLVVTGGPAESAQHDANVVTERLSPVRARLPNQQHETLVPSKALTAGFRSLAECDELDWLLSD